VAGGEGLVEDDKFAPLKRRRRRRRRRSYICKRSILQLRSSSRLCNGVLVCVS